MAVLMIVAILCFSIVATVNSQPCGLPDAITEQLWWTEYRSGTDFFGNPISRIFTTNSTYVMDITTPSNAQCDAGGRYLEARRQQWYVSSISRQKLVPTPGDVQLKRGCMEMLPFDTCMLVKRSELTWMNSSITIDQCETNIEDSGRVSWKLWVFSPVNDEHIDQRLVGGNPAPSPAHSIAGTFHISHKLGENETLHCPNDGTTVGSTITFTASAVTFNSCWDNRNDPDDPLDQYIADPFKHTYSIVGHVPFSIVDPSLPSSASNEARTAIQNLDGGFLALIRILPRAPGATLQFIDKGQITCATYIRQRTYLQLFFAIYDPNEATCAAEPQHFKDTIKLNDGFVDFVVESNLCASETCDSGGTCTDLWQDYECECQEHYTGKNCETMIDYCTVDPAVDPCGPGTCNQLPGTFTCTCPPDFTGEFCEYPNSCYDTRITPAGSPCMNGGSCINIPSEADPDLGFICLCVQEYAGRRCEEDNKCYPTDPCANGWCLPTHTDYVCICDDPYTGKNCDTTDPGVMCTTDYCLNSGTCFDTSTGSLVCFCPDGYSGTRCASFEDPCDVNQNLCEHGGTCVATGGTALCACPVGFVGNTCQAPDTDPCNMGPNQVICGNGGTCYEEVDGSGACWCGPMYGGDRCQTSITGPCDIDPCMNNGECLLANSQSFCQCADGFIGTTCETPIEEPCDDLLCEHGGVCYSNSDTDLAVCKCTAAWTGTTCTTRIGTDPCDQITCQHGGTCFSGTSGDYSCSCEPNYTGTLCEHEVGAPCVNTPCQNAGTCVPSGQDYSCICRTGFSGVNCEISPPDPCQSDPCDNGATCYPNGALSPFVCSCLDGWVGLTCDVQDPCQANPYPCENGGTCYYDDDNNQVVCNCPVGSAGPTCGGGVLCENNGPCENGGTCFPNSLNQEECKCPANFSGPKCEIEGGGGCPATCDIFCDYGNVLDDDNCPACDCHDDPCEDSDLCEEGEVCRPVLVNCLVAPCDPPYAPGCSAGVPTNGTCDPGVVCQNGGTCFQDGTQSLCACVGYWAGPTCTEWTDWFIAAIVLMALLGLILFILFIICCCYACCGWRPNTASDGSIYTETTRTLDARSTSNSALVVPTGQANNGQSTINFNFRPISPMQGFAFKNN